MRIANEIRRFMPEVLITLGADENHPDHNVAHQLVLDAHHFAAAAAVHTERAPWFVPGVYFTHMNPHTQPQGGMYIDISSVAEKKWEAMMAYASQCLYHSQNKKYVLEYIQAQNRVWGLRMRKDYAEMIIPRTPVFTGFPELKKK